MHSESTRRNQPYSYPVFDGIIPKDNECTGENAKVRSNFSTAKFKFMQTNCPLSSIQNLYGLFKKSGLHSCEERVYTLDNPGTRDMVNTTVVGGILHSLTAALKLHKLDEIQSEDQITALREAVLRELQELNCWYCFDVYVVVGQKAT
jgi:hypothetical protein